MAKEPQIVHSFPKNPLEEVRSSVTYYKGKQYVDLRIYYKGDDGEYHPSKKGLTISVELFPELEIGLKSLRKPWRSSRARMQNRREVLVGVQHKMGGASPLRSGGTERPSRFL
jgi:hypothetical protein